MRRIAAQRIGFAETKRNVHWCEPEMGTTLEEMLHPGYWAHYAPRLRPGDLIEVYPESKAWYATLLVQWTNRTAANVAPLWVADLTPATETIGTDPTEFKIKWGGPHHKFRVVRQFDNEVVKFGFLSKEDAEAWIVTQVKPQAQAA